MGPFSLPRYFVGVFIGVLAILYFPAISCSPLPALDSVHFNSSFRVSSSDLTSIPAETASKIPSHSITNSSTRASRNSLFFKVPETEMRVTLYPDDIAEELHPTQVSRCIEAMLGQLSLSESTKIVSKLSDQIRSTRLTLERLPLLLYEKNAYAMTYGDATKMFEALADFLQEQDFYYAFWYQVGRQSEFIANGFLRTYKRSGDMFNETLL